MNPNKICFACMQELPAEGAVCPSCGHDNRMRTNGPGFLKSCVLGGQYLTGKLLGRGGFGITYLGLDLRLNRKIAIKEYYPEGIVQRESETQRVIPFGGGMAEPFQKGVSRAIKEARVAARMEDIPNTVHIYSVLEENGTVYIVMEYVDGMTLTSYVQQSGGKLSWVRAWPIMEPVLITLSKVHAKGIVHRDVSPDNIMIRYSDGAPVLLDFGTARDFTTGHTEHSTSLRLGFSPMEMYTSTGVIDQRADEYAAMATLYYAITGKKPESPLNVAAGIAQVALPSTLGSDIPSGEGSAEEVLMHGLECRISDRYSTVEELRQEFHRALEQGATVITPSEQIKKQIPVTNPGQADEQRQKNEEITHWKTVGRTEGYKTSPEGSLPETGSGRQPKKSNRKAIIAICGIAFAVLLVAGLFMFLNGRTKSYTITWVNDDGTVLEVQENVAEGQTPEYHGETPGKADDDQYTYSFAGWVPDIVSADQNKTYYAFFTGKEKEKPAEELTEEPTPTPAPTHTSTPTPTPIPSWVCLDCGETNTSDNSFCESCGAKKDTWTCANCGETNTSENSFCESCGAKKDTWTCANCGETNTSENSFCERKERRMDMRKLRRDKHERKQLL